MAHTQFSACSHRLLRPYRQFASKIGHIIPLEQTRAVKRLIREGCDEFTTKDWAFDMDEFCQAQKFSKETSTAMIKAAEQSVNLRQTQKLTWRLNHLRKLLPENDIEHILRHNPKVLSTENNANLRTQIRNIQMVFPETAIKDAVHIYPRVLTSKWIQDNEEFYRANLPGLSIGMLFRRLPKLFCLDRQQETLARVDILELFYGNVAKVYGVLNKNPNLILTNWRFYARIMYLHENSAWSERAHEVELAKVTRTDVQQFAYMFRGRPEYATYMSKQIVKHGDLKAYEIRDSTLTQLEELYVHMFGVRWTRDKGLEGLGIVDDMKAMRTLRPNPQRTNYSERAGVWKTNIGL